jgi:predicted transcriptional regulator
MRSRSSEQVPETRDDVVEILLDTIGMLERSIAEQVPETPAEHRQYLEEVRTLGQLAGQYRLLTRDTDVDEMQDQLELLQRAHEIREGR